VETNHRIVLLTGNQLRHRYVAAQIAANLQLVGVLQEGTAELVAKPEELSRDDRDVVDKHFSQRDAAERNLLGEEIPLPAVPVRQVEHGGSNTTPVFDWVQSLKPDFVVLYGTSIIKDPLLSAYDGRMINIHLGLSPYYRGTGTNFWPLVDCCPECVGATIHLAVLKVDAGAILRQVRPDVQAGDGAHALGTKTIMAAVNALPSVIERFAVGELEPQTQDLSTGKVFRRKDFNADAVRTLWDNLSTGMIGEFLSDRIARLAKYPIVE